MHSPTLSPDTAQMGKTRPVSAYVATGATLTNYLVDVESGALTAAGSISLPARLQYAWPHASLPILYAACADRGEDAASHPFQLCALWRDEQGNLSLHGEPVPLPARAIHTTTDVNSRHCLTIYGGEPGLTVHRLNEDGTIGAELPRATDFSFGASPHQVRVMPGDDLAILVTRGTKGFGKPKYAPGALKLVAFDQGQVRNIGDVTPPEASTPNGFNPRNLDFHPTQPLIYAILEAQNELVLLRRNGSEVDPSPLFVGSFLQNPADKHKRQDGGAVHLHPNGRFAYVANRNDGYVDGHIGPSWVTPDPVPEFPGGENNIAVFALDAEGSNPRLVQHIDTQGLHPRCFSLDASGKLLIAGNIAPTVIREGDALTPVPASLAVFRVGDDGLLTFLHKLDLDTGLEKVWWMGIVG